MRKRTLLLPVFVAVLLTITASAAQAGAFILTLQDVTTGTTVEKVIYDDTTDDSDNAGGCLHQPDAIVFSGSVGRFNVEVFGTTFGLDGLPSPTTAPVQMNLTNFLVTSQDGGTFTATLTRSGIPAGLFGPAVVGTADYGATFDYGTVGSVKFQSWVNGQTIFNPQVTTSTDITGPSVSYQPIAIGPDPFSIVSMLTFDLNPFGAAQADTALRVRKVPEPTTLLLFGPGMLGLAALRRCRRSKAL